MTQRCLADMQSIFLNGPLVRVSYVSMNAISSSASKQHSRSLRKVSFSVDYVEEHSRRSIHWSMVRLQGVAEGPSSRWLLQSKGIGMLSLVLIVVHRYQCVSVGYMLSQAITVLKSLTRRDLSPYTMRSRAPLYMPEPPKLLRSC